MQKIIWGLLWRLAMVFGYPVAIGAQTTHAHAANAMDLPPTVVNNSLEQLAHTHSFSLILGACLTCWVAGAVIGTLYPTPDELKTTEINPWLRFLICLAGGFAAFLWVLNSDKALNLLMPLWVGGVAFVSPHLIQIVPKIVKGKLGMGDKS